MQNSKLSTEKTILILANSKKYNNRCIAGILLEKQDEGFKIVKNLEDDVIWIRPVTNSLDGAVDKKIADQYPVGSVIRINSFGPKIIYSFQSENLLADINHITLIGSSYLGKNFLSCISQFTGNAILGFVNESLDEGAVVVNKSLALIKPQNITFYYKHEEKVRCVFDLGGLQKWDLPITDILFLDKIKKLGINFFQNHKYEYFITVSLGVPFNKKVYMLAAGILYEEKEKPENDGKCWDDEQNMKIVELSNLQYAEEEIALILKRRISVIRSKIFKLKGHAKNVFIKI